MWKYEIRIKYKSAAAEETRNKKYEKGDRHQVSGVVRLKVLTASVSTESPDRQRRDVLNALCV